MTDGEMKYCITKGRVCEFATISGYCHITACIKDTVIDDNSFNGYPKWETIKANKNMIHCPKCKGTWWNKEFKKLFKFCPECGENMEVIR